MLHLPDQPFACTTCQKQLVFKTGLANRLICPACRTTHFRLSLADKPATTAEAVREDMSILQLGSTGVYEGRNFEVVGRIQYFFRDSYRNHWYLAFPDKLSGWLGEWAGNFSMFRDFDGLSKDQLKHTEPGKIIQLKDVRYLVEKLDEQQQTFAEGEIPDQHLAEKAFITLYLSETSGKMALVNIFDGNRSGESGGKKE